MLNTILRKLHLSQVVYAIERRLQKQSPLSLPSSEESIAILHRVSADTGSTCVTQHDFVAEDCDLEIIVPCYNVERYVAECIHSILSQQTRFSFFVTIINDGSTDRTGDILAQFANINNVHIITQSNRGFSGARNTGIAQAHGRYLLFVDSDDMLCPGAVEALMSLAEKTGADVVDSGHIRFANRVNRGIMAGMRAAVYDILQRPQRLAYGENSPGVTGYPCGKVLKRELFHRVEFPECYWFEDTLVWMVLEPMCRRKATSDAITFRYRMNPQSISHTAAGSVKSIDTLYVTLRLLDDRKRLGISFDQRQYDMLLLQMRNNFCRISSLPEAVRRAVFVVEAQLIADRFSNWTTSNPAVRPIQDMLRAKDYDAFSLWCKWH